MIYTTINLRNRFRFVASFNVNVAYNGLTSRGLIACVVAYYLMKKNSVLMDVY